MIVVYVACVHTGVAEYSESCPNFIMTHGG